MGLETPENLAWPNFFGTGRISWVIPIIKEKWGYKPPKITQKIYAAVCFSRYTRMACSYSIRIVSDRARVRIPARVEVLHSLNKGSTP